VLAQLRVITNAELENVEEIITPEVIEAIANDDLVMVAPMIEALRSGEFSKLDQFEDLKPFHEFFGAIVSRATGMDVQGIRERLRAEEAAERARAVGVEDERRVMYVEMLKSFGLTQAAAASATPRRRCTDDVLPAMIPISQSRTACVAYAV
jgi:hypothetical protein